VRAWEVRVASEEMEKENKEEKKEENKEEKGEEEIILQRLIE